MSKLRLEMLARELEAREEADHPDGTRGDERGSNDQFVLGGAGSHDVFGVGVVHRQDDHPADDDGDVDQTEEGVDVARLVEDRQPRASDRGG